MPDISKLFVKKPPKWGLRGDPCLWEAMKTHCQHLPQVTSVEALEGLLKECFGKLVGEDVQQGSKTYVQAFEHAGMSGGLVSHDFWLETAFPLLLSHWQEMQHKVALAQNPRKTPKSGKEL